MFLDMANTGTVEQFGDQWLSLSHDEIRLIQWYRQLPELDRRQVLRLMEQLASHPATPAAGTVLA